MDLNKIIISGRLGRDPEVKQTSEGNDWCSFTVAVNRYAKAKEKPETDWFSCTAFGKTAVFINTYFHKGDGITIEGRMQSSKKDDKTYWNLVVDRPYFEHGKKDGNSSSEEEEDAMSVFKRISDEEIPF